MSAWPGEPVSEPSLITTWQDLDTKQRHPGTYGQWYGSKSVDGHIIRLTGPHPSEDAVHKVLADTSKASSSLRM